MIIFFTFMTPYLFTHRAEHDHDAAEHQHAKQRDFDRNPVGHERPLTRETCGPGQQQDRHQREAPHEIDAAQALCERRTLVMVDGPDEP